MEPTFLSARERRGRMLGAYYELLDAHRPFQRALDGLATEITELLGRPPDRDASDRPHPDDRDGPPGVVDPRLEAFVRAWSLPTDVGILDLWDSLCDGPRSVVTRSAGRRSSSRRQRAPRLRNDLTFDAFLRAHPATPDVVGADTAATVSRRYRLRVGDRPLPGVTLIAAELAVLTPQHMEPPGWRQAGPDNAVRPGEGEPESPTEDWSDLLRYDPTGIVGDISRRPRVRRERKSVPGGQGDTSVVVDNEERLRDQGFARPGPRRRPEDIELGARYLFKRVALRMTYAAIADEEPLSNVKVDEFAVRMTVTRWAKELRIPLPRRARSGDSPMD